MPWSSYGAMSVRPAAASRSIRRSSRAWTVFAVLAVICAALAAEPTASARGATTTLASDTFNRTVSGGWGQADVGGSYTMGGLSSDLYVSGGAGRMDLPGPDVSRSAVLNSVWQRDVEINVSFRLAQRPVGGSVWVYGVARQVSPGTQYFAKARIFPDGTVRVSASKVIGDAETPLGDPVTLSTDYNAGASWNLHASFNGAWPTNVGVSAWPSSGSEPGSWQFDAQDNASALQAAGAPGLFTYGTADNSNTLSFDSYSVVDPDSGTPPPPSTGANYYVSTSGDDSDGGTFSAPWRTLQKAADAAPAG